MDPTEPTGLLGRIGIANGRCRRRVSADRGWMVIRPELPLCGHSARSAARAYDAPLRHSFDAYCGRIIGSHALSFRA